MAAQVGQRAVALVTGANKGIGFCIASQLAHARPDLQVLVGSRDLERGKEAVSKLQADGLSNVEVLQIDLDDEPSIVAAAASVSKNFGGLDVLVNNAGMAFKGSAFNEEVARTTVKTNYYGTKSVCLHFLPLIKDYGRVVNVSSRAGLLAKLHSEALKQAFTREDLTLDEVDGLMDKFVSAVGKGTATEEGWPSNTYSVSKMGVNALTRVLARDEAKNTSRKGVLINACCPGWCKTDMAGPRAPRSPEEGADVAVFLALLPKDTHANGLFFGERQQISY
jgi:carbonyl reductase 1